ncbi:PAS domain S-box protein [Natrinema thermotolerans]|uniref:histidine kinase n=1 Tax=Natrinema thermotolerans TaxID=121872 RepID=A0AAF0PFV8_9EURY|nr:PAS domain S-box protein [Natrinema thermotolerans]QCC57659.1 PAS domain S-box protein [Natrinema thermotolerans]WMT08739.1 PAS domain S-box protein [Natrinema thermotolerans]
MSIRDGPRSGGVSMDEIRVLCVDDDPQWAVKIAELLDRRDVAIDTLSATSASEALEYLVDREIDCIVSEYDLPDADGLALLEDARSEVDSIPFLLVTGSGSEAIASEAISAGVTDYVRKADDPERDAALADAVVDAVEAAQRRRERERQLHAVETAQEGVSILDSSGRFVYVNRAYADLYGYEPAELIGEHWELIYPDDEVATAHEEIIPTVMAEGEWYGETTGLRADGTTFVEAHSLSTTGNGDLICTVRDITDRKERERDLERYETIIEALGDPVYTVGDDGRYTYVNDAYAEMTGYEKDEIVGEPISFLLDDESVERGEATVGSLLSADTEGRQCTYEITIETSDGERIRCEDNVSLLPLADGAYRGVAGVVRDITARTERKRELEEYETILETIPDEAYQLDAEGYITKVVPPSNGEVTTTGYRPEELVGEHVSLIMDEDDIATAEAEIRALLADPDRNHASFEMETVTRDGRRRPNENHISILPSDEDGRFQGTVGVLRDISDRKERERELKAQNERLERFASIVSHDLRNPLNVAQGRLEQARRTCDCDETHLEEVAWAHDRMGVLIENILTIARDRDPQPDPEPIDLAAIVDDCWDHVDTGTAALRVDTDAVVRADRARLKQLLENLLRNAVDHSDVGPAGPDGDGDRSGVTITVGDLAGGDGFYVADDGPGIPPDERERVFESGYSSDGDGTGLGLAIVERIAAAHGWTATATESAAGGARFELADVDSVGR